MMPLSLQTASRPAPSHCGQSAAWPSEDHKHKAAINKNELIRFIDPIGGEVGEMPLFCKKQDPEKRKPSDGSAFPSLGQEELRIKNSLRVGPTVNEHTGKSTKNR